MGKSSRVKAERRRAPVPPVGKKQPFWNRPRIVVAAAAAAVVAGAAVGAVVAFGGGGSPAPAPVAQSALAGLQTGNAPWSANAAQLSPRLSALGLPRLTQEGTVLHIHQHLDVYVNGARETVPAGIGIDPAQRFISTVHTHDASGIVHVESPTQGTFTLGQFFGIWGVRFTQNRIGDYRGYRLYLDGKRYTGNPTRLVLRDHQELAVVVGKPPARIPSGYRFPAGD